MREASSELAACRTQAIEALQDRFWVAGTISENEIFILQQCSALEVDLRWAEV